MATVKTGEKTVVQKLSDLVDWWIRDRRVEIRFIPNNKKSGKIAPEFDCEYWIDGRRVTERCLSMLCMVTLQELNYNYNLAKIISTLTALSWQAYIEQTEYPDFLKISKEVKMKRPRGRPQTRPVTISYDDKYVGSILVEPGITKLDTSRELLNKDNS